jgi:hypothetical protein
MEFKLNEYHGSGLTDEELLSDVKRVANIFGDTYLSVTKYRKHGKYGEAVFRTHFGSWMNVLKILELRTEKNYNEMQRISDNEIISDLLFVKKQLSKETITSGEYDTYGKYSYNTIKFRFGSWSKFLEKVGLKQTGFIGKIDNEDLLKEIERIWILLGRQPTTTDVRNGISKYDLCTFSRRFGGWRSALQYFLDWINTEKETDIKENVEEENSIKNYMEENINYSEKNIVIKNNLRKTPRNINLKLRFKVLLRDNFKCCSCGASPAKNPIVELHIDHIIPWSKGGETVINNLQTLCSKCNLGKSNI